MTVQSEPLMRSPGDVFIHIQPVDPFDDMHILKPEGLDAAEPGTDVMNIKKVFKDKSEVSAAP
jgi:hypothetical protein